jgi:hypothetical protein
MRQPNGKSLSFQPPPGAPDRLAADFRLKQLALFNSWRKRILTTVDPRELFMIGSNLTHRGMVSGLPVKVSAPAAVSSDRFIGGAHAQSPREILVLVLGSFFGTFRRLLGRSKKGYGAYPFTLGGLGERSRLLSKDKNFETHIDDISNVAGWKRTRTFHHAQSALAKSETHHFFQDRENVGIPQLHFDA